MAFSEETLKQLQQQHLNEEYLQFHCCLVASLALANDKKVEHLIDDDGLELRNLGLPSSIYKFILLFLPGGIELVLSTTRQDDNELQISASVIEKCIRSLYKDSHIDLFCSTNQTTTIPPYCLQEAPIMIATIIQNYWTLFKEINPKVNLQSPEIMKHLITSKTYFNLMQEVILSDKFQTFLDRVAKTYTKQGEQQEAPAIITPPQKITYITNDDNNNEPSTKEPSKKETSTKEPSTKEPVSKKMKIYGGLSLFPPSLATIPEHKRHRAREKSSATDTLSTTTVTKAKRQEVADNGAAAPKEEKRQEKTDNMAATAVPEENCQEGKEKRAVLPDDKCQEPTQKNTDEDLQQRTASMLSAWKSEAHLERQALQEQIILLPPSLFDPLYDQDVWFPASSERDLQYHTSNFSLNNNLPVPGNLTLQNPSVQKLLS